jgi:hypothetical protein
MEIIVECGLSDDEVAIPENVWKKIPYFIALMGSGMEESQSHRVNKPDTDSATIRTIIKCYEDVKIYYSNLPEVGTMALERLKNISDQLGLEIILRAVEDKIFQSEHKAQCMRRKHLIERAKTMIKSTIHRVGVVGETGRNPNQSYSRDYCDFYYDGMCLHEDPLHKPGETRWIHVPVPADVGEFGYGVLPGCQHPTARYGHADVQFLDKHVKYPHNGAQLQDGDVVIYDISFPSCKNPNYKGHSSKQVRTANNIRRIDF